MAETFRTHGWSLLLKYTVPFSSMGNALEFVDDEEKGGGRPLKPISISNKNLLLLPFLKDQIISSKGLLPSMAETFRTHDWSLLLKYTVPLSSMGNTPEFVDVVEKSGGKPIFISDKDLQLPSFLEFDEESFLRRLKRRNNLEMLLPSMAETFKTKDWSLLQKFSSMDSNLNIEDALKLELAAICVCFLFTKVPGHVKEGVARTLTFISLGTSNVTKMSTDQTGVEDLVVRILSSGNTEAQRQVCLALSVLADFRSKRLAVTLGTGIAGIQDQLLQLVFNLSHNPDLTYPVTSAVASVSLLTKGMRKKIVETELLDSWLVKLLSRKDDESIMADAFRTVACIARERELWDHLKDKLLAPIFDGLHYTTSNVRLLRALARAIFKITKYGSSEQINDLAEIGGLKFLFSALSVDDEDLYGVCLKAIENILRAGEAEAKKAKKAENEYAKMIDGYSMGWDQLFLYFGRLYDPSIGRRADDLCKYRIVSD